MAPQMWLVMGAFWLVQAIWQHASQNPGNVVTAPSVGTWVIGLPAIASIVWAVFSKRFASIDKTKLLASFTAALSDGKLTGAEIGQLLKDAGFDASILTDIAKGLGGQLLGGLLPAGSAEPGSDLAFLQQRLSLALASNSLGDAIESKGAPQEIAFTFDDGTVLSDQFIIRKPSQVDQKDQQLKEIQDQLKQLQQAQNSDRLPQRA